MLFAHCGIMGRAEDEFSGYSFPNPNPNHPIAVDYTKTLKQMYEDITRYAFQGTQTLQLLPYTENLVTLDERSDDVFLWCLDWRYRSPEHFDGIYSNLSNGNQTRFFLTEYTLPFPLHREFCWPSIFYASIFACVGIRIGWLGNVTQVVSPEASYHYTDSYLSSFFWSGGTPNKQVLLGSFEHLLKTTMLFAQTMRFLERLQKLE